MDIQNLRSLEGEVEWEWTCGSFDYHVQYDRELDIWLLEKFRSAVPNPEVAHQLEQECESLADALLFSIAETEAE